MVVEVGGLENLVAFQTLHALRCVDNLLARQKQVQLAVGDLDQLVIGVCLPLIWVTHVYFDV